MDQTNARTEDSSTSRDYLRIERALRFLEERASEQPTLDDVARVVGLTPFHFQRLFTRFAGVSPKRFVQALTAENARAMLRQSKTVLETAFAVGLSGPSRLHDLMVSVDGMTPGECRTLGAEVTIRFGQHETPFGPCAIGATTRGVCRLEFLSDQNSASRCRDGLAAEWPGANLSQDPDTTGPLVKQIFAGRGKPEPSRPLLDVRGTNFQLRVWRALLQMPEGSAISYGDLAMHLGSPGAARAVGSAVAKNPVAHLIPCHRVVRSTGVLGQYRWGPLRKRAILAREWALSSAPRSDNG